MEALKGLLDWGGDPILRWLRQLLESIWAAERWLVGGGGTGVVVAVVAVDVGYRYYCCSKPQLGSSESTLDSLSVSVKTRPIPRSGDESAGQIAVYFESRISEFRILFDLSAVARVRFRSRCRRGDRPLIARAANTQWVFGGAELRRKL